MNIGVILAAGKSSRFEDSIPKQLFTINDKPIINHSIDILSKTLDDVIIITNSSCHHQIKTDKTIIINDDDDRIKSIKKALDYLDGGDWENILIHDAARPFITEWHINELIESQTKNVHSQYYLPIVNGLAKISESGSWEIPNRNDYIQLCSPQITDFKLFNNIFREYIETNMDCEVLPIVSKLKYQYNLIKGDNKYLRKITTINDIYK
jgi:2-C-methyl-D-erythritol 4-phosphate cytidylyltransferase